MRKIVKQSHLLYKTLSYLRLPRSIIHKIAYRVSEQNKYVKKAINPSESIREDKNNKFNSYFSMHNFIISNFTTPQRVFDQKVEGKHIKTKINKILKNILDELNDHEYPSIHLSKQFLLNFQKILSKRMHELSNQELNTLLNFYSKFDQNVTESLIFLQFTKFNLRDWRCTLKAQYGIDVTQHNLYSLFKQFVKKVATKSFLSRKPPYERILIINNREQSMLNCLPKDSEIIFGQVSKALNQSKYYLRKKSWSLYHKSDLFLNMLNQQFNEIKLFYEKNMQQNLYHPKGKQLLKKLAKLSPILCLRSISTAQHSYLRQLYMHLYIVVDDVQLETKLEGISIYDQLHRFLKETVETNNQDIKTLKQSKVVNKYIDKVRQNIQFGQFKQIDLTKKNNLSLLNSLILVKKYRLAKQPSKDIEEIILQLLSPICFALYFSRIYQVYQTFSDYFHVQLIKKLTKETNQDSYTIAFKHLKLDQSFQLFCYLKKVYQNLDQTKDQKIIDQILEATLIALNQLVSRDYQTISCSDILELFKCLLKIKQIQQMILKNIQKKHQLVDGLEQNCKMLKQFLFRYFSDNQNEFSGYEYAQVIITIHKLNDYSSFNDQTNSYPLNIFEQTCKLVEARARQIGLFIQQKVRSDQLTQNQGDQLIRQILKKNQSIKQNKKPHDL